MYTKYLSEIIVFLHEYAFKIMLSPIGTDNFSHTPNISLIDVILDLISVNETLSKAAKTTYIFRITSVGN